MSNLSLTRVGIDQFRGLRHLALDGIGQINILVGGNSSGKTSVLEALAILCQPSNPDEWLTMIRRRDFGRLDESQIQSLRWCFTREQVSPDSEELVDAHCEFECAGGFPLRRLRVDYAEFFGIPTEEELRPLSPYVRRREDVDLGPRRGVELVHRPIWDSLPGANNFSAQSPRDNEPQSLKVWDGDLLRFGRPPRGTRIACETLTPYSYQLNRMQVRSQSRQIFQRDLVVELLRHFDADVEDIELASFYGERPAIYVKHRRLGVAPLSIFGDAMRRCLLMATTLQALKHGGVLLIDEVETGIHVGALGRVFSWLVDSACKMGVQVFVTTHSLEALDALIAAPSIDAGADLVVFQLTQGEERTQSKRFAGDLLHRLRFERGLDLR